MGMLRQCFGVFRSSIKSAIAYRFDFFATMIIAPASLAIYYFLWKAIFTYTGGSIAGYEFQEMVTYYFLTWILLVLTYSGVEHHIRYYVRSGELISPMLKPFSFFQYELNETFGKRAFAIITELLPLLLVGFFLLKIRLELSMLPYFLLAIIPAFLLSFLVYFVSALSAFWLINNNGVTKIRRIVQAYFSGAILPLSFFPAWFTTTSHYLPFQYMTYIPANIWLGKYTTPEIWSFMAIAFIWVLILYAIFIVIWKLAIKKIASVGI